MTTISGTELAQKFPSAAARLVVRAWREGGGVANAWEVLCSAYDPREALSLVKLAAGDEAEALATHLTGVEPPQ